MGNYWCTVECTAELKDGTMTLSMPLPLEMSFQAGHQNKVIFTIDTKNIVIGRESLPVEDDAKPILKLSTETSVRQDLSSPGISRTEYSVHACRLEKGKHQQLRFCRMLQQRDDFFQI